MDIIMNISKPVELIGKQKIRVGTFLPSVYSYSVFQDNCYLIFNLFTRGMISLTSEEYSLYQPIEITDPADVDSLYTFLIENYYYVPADQDEQKSYVEMNDLIQSFDYSKYISGYTILTTTACNARCFYCFEQDFVPVSMTESTAHELVEYMIRNSDGKTIHIHWFGGEPLCNVKVIDQISSELEERGVTFYANMTSNGYAFTPDIISRVKDKWKINYIQITLDGMEEEHNRRKNYKAVSDNPFLRTIENIHALLDAGVFVSLRVNFDPNNIDSVKELLPYLANEFSGKEKLSVYVAKIFEDCGSWKSGRTADQSIMMDQLHKEFTRFLADKKLSRTKAYDNRYKYYYCGANNVHHRTVGPDGKFLLCHNLSASDGYGSIFDGITDQELFKRWTVKSDIPEKCNGCPMLPECTTFSLCPSLDSMCREAKEHIVEIRVKEKYRRYLKTKEQS